MRRALVTLAVVGVFAACGFPEVTYDAGSDAGNQPDSPASAEGSGDDDAAPSDATTGDGASSGGDATADGEASTANDAAGDGSGSSSGGDTGADVASDAPGDSSATDGPLDALEEGPAESGADAPADAPADAHDAGTDAPVCDFDQDTYKATGATCGGNDCCDTDNKAHPGQTTYYTTPDACGSFDYNCNGTLDPEYPANLTCGGTALTGCTGGSAFISSDPGCGGSGLYGTCVGNGLLACQPGNETTVTQGCH